MRRKNLKNIFLTSLEQDQNNKFERYKIENNYRDFVESANKTTDTCFLINLNYNIGTSIG